jgi:hypothetical protein
MQSRQAKTHSPDPAKKATEPTEKAASSPVASKSMPAWTSAWGDQPPAGLQLEQVSSKVDSQDTSGSEARDTLDPNDEQARDGKRTGSANRIDTVTHTALVSRMERAFGMPFNEVRMRTGNEAAHRASALNARAYTDGKEIGFADGVFAPDTRQGLHTIAHEFAHVAQMRGGTGGSIGLATATFGTGTIRTRSIIDNDQERDAIEEDAEAAATALIGGETPAVGEAEQEVFTKDKKATGEIPTPPPRTYITKMEEGIFIFIFNTKDVKTWGSNRSPIEIRYYFLESFIGDNVRLTAMADEFSGTQPYSFQAADVEKVKRPYVLALFKRDFQEQVLRWMAIRYPDIEPKKRITAVHDLDPQLRAGSMAKTAPTPQTEKRRPEKGSPEGEPVGEEISYVQFEPIGTMKIVPELPKYVVGAEVTAFVEFDESDPDRMLLNYFPRRARFDWNVLKGHEVVERGSIFGKYGGTGDIRYTFKAPAEGRYTIKVSVASRYFIANKTLELFTPIITVTEERRKQEVFKELLIDETGNDPSKPFVRDATGKIQLKDTKEERKFSIDDQIRHLNFQKGVISELLKQGKLTKEQANTNLASIDEMLDDLNKFSKGETVSKPLYMVRGIFLNREDSTSQQIHAFMHQTQRLPADSEGVVRYQVTLYDSTFSPGKLIQHTGDGEAKVSSSGEAAAYVEAEKHALADMATHWHMNNEYPNGKILLAVQSLETGIIYGIDIETDNPKKTVKKVASYVAAIGGVALLAASAFTGGTTAPLGIIILEGMVAGATITDVALSIDQRLETHTFKFDKEFVMDMLQIVTLGLQAFGTLAKAFSTLKSLTKGFQIVNLTLSATTLLVISVQTSQAISEVEAEYAVLIGQETDPKKQRELQQQRDAIIAKILGSAAVNGGLILVSTGVSLKHTPGGEIGGTTSKEVETPPAEKPKEVEIPPERPATPEARTQAEAKVSEPPEPSMKAPEPPKTEPKAPSEVEPPKPSTVEPTEPTEPTEPPTEAKREPGPTSGKIPVTREELIQQWEQLQQEKAANEKRIEEFNNKIKEQEAKSKDYYGDAEKIDSERKTSDFRDKVAAKKKQGADASARRAKLQEEKNSLTSRNQQINSEINRIEVKLDPSKKTALPCFSGDTLVWTVTGPKRIDQLRPGESIFSFDFEREELVARRIAEVRINKTLHFYDIHISDSVIRATGSHRFWVEDQKEWITARDLREGMLLKSLSSANSRIVSIVLCQNIKNTTYNLEIDRTPNYFVGSGILVHNGGPIHYGFGNYILYEARNTLFPDKIYIGITDERERREGEHQRRASKKLEDRSKLSQEEIDFRKFMEGAELIPRATGLTKEQAEYLEQKNIDIELAAGDYKVVNPKKTQVSKERMKVLEEKIINDPKVQAERYCP